MTKLTNFEKTREWYKAVDEPIHEGVPSADESVISNERLLLKVSLVLEEAFELLGAAIDPKAEEAFSTMWKTLYASYLAQGDSAKFNRDLVEIADALSDIDVVGTGMALELGIPHDDVFADVFNSNMTKVDSATGKAIRSDGSDGNPVGKILKPKNFVPADPGSVLRGYGADV